jgi:hypothetical protein
MEKWIGYEEWSTVFSIVTDERDLGQPEELDECFPKADIPDEKLAWIERVFTEFAEVQAYLRSFWDDEDTEISEGELMRLWIDDNGLHLERVEETA